MQITVEKTTDTKSLQRNLHVELTIENLDNQVKKKLAKIAKKTNLPGFRPGKVPLHMIERDHLARVKYETIHSAAESAFKDAIKAENLQLATQGELTKLDYDDGNPQQVSLTATIHIRPEVDVESLSTLELERKVPIISEEDVAKRLLDDREQNPLWIDKLGPAEIGDKVFVDFEGTIDGQAFAGNRAEDFSFILGKDRDACGL